MRGKEFCRSMLTKDFDNPGKATRSELATVSNAAVRPNNSKNKKHASANNDKENNDPNILLDDCGMEQEDILTSFNNLAT